MLLDAEHAKFDPKEAEAYFAKLEPLYNPEYKKEEGDPKVPL